MTERSVPDATGADNGADAWALLGRVLGGEGVVTGLQGLLLTANVVRMDVGTAVVGGVVYQNDVIKDFTSGQNLTSQPRIDRLVLRRTTVGSTMTVRAFVTSGAPASNPVALPLVQSATGVWEDPICRWTVPANGVLPLANLVDERVYASAPVPYKVNAGLFVGQPNTTTSTCGIVHGLGINARITVTPIDAGSPADRIVRFVQVGQDATTAQFLCQRLDNTIPSTWVRDNVLAVQRAQAGNDTGLESNWDIRPQPFHDNVVAFHWVGVSLS